MVEVVVVTCFAVTMPPELIAATDVFEEDHEVIEVTALLLPSEYVAVAVQVPEVPSFKEEGQEMARLERVGEAGPGMDSTWSVSV